MARNESLQSASGTANVTDVDVVSSALPSGAATSAKQLADGHNVAVSNMIPAVETGLATSAIQTDGTQQAKVKETAPTDATKNNGSLALTYTGTNLTTIAKTIGGVTYNKTLSYTGAVLDSVSAWVAA